jgi:hypothetical protein
VGLSDWFRRRRDRAAVQRRQLEGGAELLEEVLPTYLILLRALERDDWRVSLKEAKGAGDSAVAFDDDVEAALATARRRMASEGWSRFDEVPRLVVKVELARAQLSRVVAKRVVPTPSAHAPLGYRLACLLAAVFPKQVPVLTRPHHPTVELRPGAAQRFRVKLLYREPTYELRTGVPRTYALELQVDAASETDARARAQRQLFTRSAMSGVGWVPEVVSAQVMLEGGVSATVTPPVPLAYSGPPLGPEPHAELGRLPAFKPERKPLGARRGGLVFYNAPADAAPEEFASLGHSKIAIAGLDHDYVCRHQRAAIEFRPEAGIRELVGLAADLAAMARRADTAEWAREEAVALARDAVALAQGIDPTTADVAARALETMSVSSRFMDISGRRIGVLLAAFSEFGVRESEYLRNAQAFAVRLAVLLKMLEAETPRGTLA